MHPVLLPRLQTEIDVTELLMLEENKNIYLKWLKNPVKAGKMPGTDPKPLYILEIAFPRS